MKSTLLLIAVSLSTQLFGQPNNKINDTLYQFSGRDQHNKTVNNSSLNKKISFVSFWFAECMPCINEISNLISLYKKYEKNKGFQLLIFTFDDKNKIKSTIKKYLFHQKTL